MQDLWRRRFEPQGRAFLIEFHKRLAYPVACLVFMLVGVPLGLGSRRGGKSTGFVLTVALVFVYYFFSSVGVAMAKQGKIGPGTGVWIANVVFALLGALLLREASTGDVTPRGAAFMRVVSHLGAAIERRLPKRFRPEPLTTQG